MDFKNIAITVAALAAGAYLFDKTSTKTKIGITATLAGLGYGFYKTFVEEKPNPPINMDLDDPKYW